MAAMQLDCPRVDSTATAAIRAAERDERPARLTHTMHEARGIYVGVRSGAGVHGATVGASDLHVGS